MDSEDTDSASDSTPPLNGDLSQLSQFIENMGLYFEEYDVPRIGGRILGLLLAASHPITADDMAEALEVSRSSVSTNLRTLLMTGLAERVSVPGERNDFYVASDEAWEVILKIRLGRVESLREMAEDGLGGISNRHPARRRLEEILAWTDLVGRAYESLLEEWQSRQEGPD